MYSISIILYDRADVASFQILSVISPKRLGKFTQSGERFSLAFTRMPRAKHGEE